MGYSPPKTGNKWESLAIPSPILSPAISYNSCFKLWTKAWTTPLIVLSLQVGGGGVGWGKMRKGISLHQPESSQPRRASSPVESGNGSSEACDCPKVPGKIPVWLGKSLLFPTSKSQSPVASTQPRLGYLGRGAHRAGRWVPTWNSSLARGTAGS